MANLEGESKGPEITRNTNQKESPKGNLYRAFFVGNMLLGSVGCSPSKVESFSIENNNSDLESKSVQTLSESDIRDLGLDFSNPPEGRCFLDDHVESGLDVDGFPLEWEEEEEVVEAQEVVDIGGVLNKEVREVLSLQPDLSFNEKGELFFEDEQGEKKSVLTIETDRHLNYPYESLKDVKFFVIHYDGAPQTYISGAYRTVLGTVNGLNREGNPSVHFCVDPYPVTDEIVEKEGLGVILSQAVNTVPLRGRHVMIGIELETGREDVNRIKTARLYEELGVGSRFVDFVDGGNRDFDAYSLGVEQVGTNYSLNFPLQFPPNQQIANMLALSRAVVSRYDLSVWDMVGHHEVQEKSDPGDEYMLTLRYLLGISYAIEEEDFGEDFLGTDDIYEYFSNLKQYSISRMGEERYGEWNRVYGMDTVLEFLEGEFGVVEEFEERIITQEEKEFLANNEIYHLDREKPIIAMTYDDGGREEYIRYIMEVYETYGLRTTFFVTGQWVERNKELTKEMIERGFEIGCHGWDHTEMSILSREEATRQIEDFMGIVKEIDSNYEVRLIRFPYGSRTQLLREIAAEYGLQSIMWSNESGGVDEGTYDNVMRGLQSGDIVLSHSTRWYDVYHTERILEGLLGQGYEVVTVGEGLEWTDSSEQ